jgi:hypothetical protein
MHFHIEEFDEVSHVRGHHPEIVIQSILPYFTVTSTG